MGTLCDSIAGFCSPYIPGHFALELRALAVLRNLYLELTRCLGINDHSECDFADLADVCHAELALAHVPGKFSRQHRLNHRQIVNSNQHNNHDCILPKARR